MSATAHIDHEAFARLFAAYGGTDFEYLRRHYPRFAATRQRTLDATRLGRGSRVLDVGAHWLHQSLLYSLDGLVVTALDTPETFDKAEVKSLAEAYAIRLVRESDLANPSSLGDIPDNTFDLVLFTEIIEHITFNPVAMWREIYRVMKPDANLVVTTPNYYSLRGRSWRWLRFLRGMGSGVEIDNLLRQPTFAHHWKEYSRRELLRYFARLSPDFRIVNASYVNKYEPSDQHWLVDRGARLLERVLPFLSPNIYLQIELEIKDRNILITPAW